MQKLAKIFIHKAKFIPLYFSNENLKDVYVQRAEIAEFTLNSSGNELDFVFPQRPLRQNKIRFGIYAKAIASCSEAFATFPVYEYLNREEFEIFFYVHQCDGNPTEKRAQKLANKFTELPKDLKNSVDIIRADDLDVLFFSNSLTAVRNQAFILASHRLARFQCVHFCQPVTSGLKHIDFYFLGSMIQENGKAENHYSEQPVRLDGSGICFDIGSNHAESTASIKTDQFGIQDKNTVFVSGANFYKVIPELRHLWAKLLAKVPDSVLILYPFGSRWSNSYPKNIFIHNIEKVLLQYGIENEHLIILDPLPTREDIMELLRHTDIYLDAVPYSGATSLLDPLEVGVPPIVMEGEEMRCCQGAAILKELGVDELVVHSEEEYLELAGRLAIENEFRTDLRQTILNRMQDKPPFLDPKGYARKISTALKNIVNSQTSV